MGQFADGCKEETKSYSLLGQVLDELAALGDGSDEELISTLRVGDVSNRAIATVVAKLTGRTVSETTIQRWKTRVRNGTVRREPG